MQRAALATVVCYWEFRCDPDYWLPALGVVCGGYVVGQMVILAVLAAIIFGSVVILSYRFLDWLLD